MNARMLDNEIRLMRQEKIRLEHERAEMREVSSTIPSTDTENRRQHHQNQAEQSLALSRLESRRDSRR